MAAKIETFYREVLAGMSPEDKHYGFFSRQLRELEDEVQLDYLDFDKFPKTEAEVKAEIARQADKYIQFGLHKHPELKLSKGKFKDMLIALVAYQPENFAGRFDIPVAVLGQVPAKDVYEAAGVDYYLGGLDVGDWPDDPKGYVTPQVSYLTWMQDGARNLNKKVEVVRANLEVDTRGATESDGSGLYVVHSRILKRHYIDLPGTSLGSDRAPYVRLFYGRPGVDWRWVDLAHPLFGSALCGSLPRRNANSNRV